MKHYGWKKKRHWNLVRQFCRHMIKMCVVHLRQVRKGLKKTHTKLFEQNLSHKECFRVSSSEKSRFKWIYNAPSHKLQHNQKAHFSAPKLQRASCQLEKKSLDPEFINTTNSTVKDEITPTIQTSRRRLLQCEEKKKAPLKQGLTHNILHYCACNPYNAILTKKILPRVFFWYHVLKISEGWISRSKICHFQRWKSRESIHRNKKNPPADRNNTTHKNWNQMQIEDF